MNVKVFALVHGNVRDELLKQNVSCAGYDFDLELLNLSPLHFALNTGLSEFARYDAIMFLANDIKEPDDWLKLRVDLNVGIAAIYPSALPVPHGQDLIGNYLINSKVISEIGYFTGEYGNYGPIDLDYCNRARIAGFKTEYVPNVVATHYSYNDDTIYGYSKSECVGKVWGQYKKDIDGYNAGTKSIKNFKSK